MDARPHRTDKIRDRFSPRFLFCFFFSLISIQGLQYASMLEIYIFKHIWTINDSYQNNIVFPRHRETSVTPPTRPSITPRKMASMRDLKPENLYAVVDMGR